MSNKLTHGQVVVLDRLMRTISAGSVLTVPEFADVATSKKLVEEWAITPLKALEKRHLVERTPKKVGKASTWRITTRGVDVLMQHRLGL